ncbi:MAG: sulfotransferase [Pseudomonadota bacterium]
MAKSTERTMGVFSPDFFQDRKTFGHLTPGPVFIVGMPRSGTTLTERILAAHPQISGGGERYDVPNLTGGIEDYPHALLEKDGDWAVEAGRRIHRSMFSRAAEADFATDKLPGNHVNLGLISMILPGSKFIYCKRNPIDNCLSCFEQHFADGLNFTFSLEGLAEAYMQHEKLMGHWFDVCPIPIHTVEYENLVSDPEPVVRGMLDYIGVKWDPACLNPEKTEQSIATASVWQARQPINKGSIARWRRYEKQLQPLIEALEQK